MNFKRWLHGRNATPSNPGDLGATAEEAAAQYLQRQGLKLIERNYRCRRGEIDLIMSDEQQLIFVEVRYRKNSRFGHAAETVNPRKQKKVISAASHYLNGQSESTRCRFDVIAINGSSDTDKIQDTAEKFANIDWLINAFGP